MKKRKIRVFLGGYVNSQNPQNNNCRSLSEHLDKEKFEVWTMITWHCWPKNNTFVRTQGIHYIYDTPSPWTEKLHLPFWLFAWMSYAIGVLRCDVAYLPKGEYPSFCRLIAKLSGCKIFSTLEGVLASTNLSKVKYPQKYIQHFKDYEPHLYAITVHLIKSESKRHGLNFTNPVLYLGVESDKFHQKEIQERFSLRNIVLIANFLKHKGINDFLSAAYVFPQLKFHVVGGSMLDSGPLDEYCIKNGINNVVSHGYMSHEELSTLLQTIDLMYFPSRSEGFPKVMLETACAGVPTLCYGDYGADEWITTSKDGYVVNTFDEAKAVIQKLIDNPEHLQELSENAVELGKRFDWKVLVKVWEKEIEKIASEK